MARNATAKASPQAKKPTKIFSVVLNTAGLTSKAKGKTISEALAGLNPKIMKVRGIITLRSGKLTAEMKLMPMQMRRLAVNNVTREIIGKRLAMLLR